MHFDEIVENWATRYPKERALTLHSRAFGTLKERTGRIGQEESFAIRGVSESSTTTLRGGLKMAEAAISFAIGRQSALAEAYGLYRMIQPECSVEELRELIAVPPHIERGSNSCDKHY